MMSGERLDKPKLKLPEQKQAAAEANAAKQPKPYPYPMIELLNLRTQTLPDTRELDRVNAVKLEQTLESFGIPARVQRVTHGPAVTRFELGLVSSGINVKRIMNIADNIALDMAANGGVRIEVPIPGTNLFGVEVPNKEIISVSLAEVLTSPEMTNAKSPLSVALGKDIAGRPIICDLAKMPHLLIAGQTGSGKSVCINSIINSLLYRSSPEEVRMIMIDPKVVELQGYNHVSLGSRWRGVFPPRWSAGDPYRERKLICENGFLSVLRRRDGIGRYWRIIPPDGGAEIPAGSGRAF